MWNGENFLFPTKITPVENSIIGDYYFDIASTKSDSIIYAPANLNLVDGITAFYGNTHTDFLTTALGSYYKIAAHKEHSDGSKSAFITLDPAYLLLKNENKFIEEEYDSYAKRITDWFGITTNIKDEKDLKITEYKLFNNYPNPFNPTTIIKYSISVRDTNFASLTNKFVTLKIYDVLGRVVSTLVNKEQQAGSYEVEFDASSVNRRISSGVYFYSISAGEFTDVKKMLLPK